MFGYWACTCSVAPVRGTTVRLNITPMKTPNWHISWTPRTSHEILNWFTYSLIIPFHKELLHKYRDRYVLGRMGHSLMKSQRGYCREPYSHSLPLSIPCFLGYRLRETSFARGQIGSTDTSAGCLGVGERVNGSSEWFDWILDMLSHSGNTCANDLNVLNVPSNVSTSATLPLGWEFKPLCKVMYQSVETL